MGHGGNVIEELTTDHREVEELFSQIRNAPSADERKEIADHAEVEELLKSLERQTADNQELGDEEAHLFVQLNGVCSPNVLEDLGEKIRTAKKVAPTRPHPSAPSTPPGNKPLAPGAGLVDRARDFVSGRGK
ncbi:hemerythrin domain-containing protein [Streptomyces sp. NPDC048636]|uniref:hemerythrin domain-containing protein n=1 Tax=Streptomyces sp. NPDC048636 TaxID=3155762 RepID=UPI00343D6DA9